MCDMVHLQERPWFKVFIYGEGRDSKVMFPGLDREGLGSNGDLSHVRHARRRMKYSWRCKICQRATFKSQVRTRVTRTQMILSVKTYG